MLTLINVDYMKYIDKDIVINIDGKSIESVTGLTYDAWRDQVMKEMKFNY